MNKQKIVLLSLLCMVILMLSIGCSGGGGSGNIAQGTLTKLLVNSIDSTNCDQFQTEPCYVNYNISFYKPETTDSNWYWVGLNNGVSTYHIGQNMKLGPFEEEIDTVATAYYYQGFTPAEYDIWVYRCSSYADIGGSSCEPIAVTDPNVRVHINSFDSDCFTNCCSSNMPRYWAGAVKDTSNLIGIKSLITPRYGELCGYSSGSNDSAQNNVFIGINEKFAEGGAFLQLGYRKYRFAGVGSEKERVYFEFKLPGMPGSLNVDIDNHSTPLAGFPTSFEIVIDVDSQLCGFEYASIRVWTLNFSQYQWNATTGKFAIWAGEIRGHESDMPGTATDPVRFDDCQVRIDGDTYNSTVFFRSPPDTMFTLDATEWGIDFIIGMNSFTIWDKKPLP